uniref:UBC core domain-containing protein n=1 Tax=viral metagenome TaxID=1070528 RepID=A0A6C0D9Q3_9ZZZZ
MMSLDKIYRNRRRINQEYKRFCSDNKNDIYTFLEITGLNVRLELNGPKDTIYEKKKYKIHVMLSSDYPFEPPKIKVLTPIIHPNIYEGEVCVDILKHNWTPAYSIHTVMIVIYHLLAEPDISDVSIMTQSLSSNHLLYKKTSMRHFQVWGGRRDFIMYLARMRLLERKQPNETDKDNYSKVVEKNEKFKNILHVLSRRDYLHNIFAYL